MFQSLLGESHSEVGVSILGILCDNDVEIGDSFFVLLDHLVSLSTFMDIAKVAWDLLYASRVGIDRLFKLLQATIGQTKVIVNISLVGHEWFVFESLFHRLDTFLVLLEGKVSYTLLVEDLWRSVVDFKSSIKIIYSKLILLHVKVALRSIL